MNYPVLQELPFDGTIYRNGHMNTLEAALTAGTEKIKWDKMLSTESKKGSPSPAGRPITAVSKTPPNESPSAAAFSIS